MKKILVVLGSIALLGLIGFGLWFYRPWSPYSPALLIEFQDESKGVENLRSFDRFFPKRPVAQSDTPRALTEADGTWALPETYIYKGETKSLADFLKTSTTTGLLVMKNGQIAHEAYYRGADAESRFTSWSVAKSMVATMIFMALEEGKIASLDDPAKQYAGQYDGTDFGETTIRNLLTMSSGMDFNEDYAAEGSDIRNYFFGTFVMGRSSDKLLFPYKRDRDQGKDFTYISPNSHVLASVLRAVYNKPLAYILADKVWNPAGMGGSAYWSQNLEGDSGMALGYCCLNARLRDYARFGLFWLDALSGKGPGADLLPDNAADLVLKPATPLHIAGQTKYPSRGYSHHFWLAEDADGVFFANGVYGQVIWMDTTRNLVIARNASDPDFAKRTPEVIAAFKAIAAHTD